MLFISFFSPFEIFLIFKNIFSSSLSNKSIHVVVVLSYFVLFFRAVWARGRASMITITGNAQTSLYINMIYCLHFLLADQAYVRQRSRFHAQSKELVRGPPELVQYFCL